jgi:hypothetical protein
MSNKTKRNRGRGGTYVPSENLKKFKLNQKRESFMRKMRDTRKR